MKAASIRSKKTEIPQKTLRKEREREWHRQTILAAAETVFAGKGFHGATIEEIAREAGFAAGTLYNFFENKDALYASVILSHHQELTSRFDAIVAAHDSPTATLAAIVNLLLSHFTAHQGFVRIFFETSPGAGIGMLRTLPKELGRIHAHYTETLTGLFRKGIANGEFSALDPLLLTFCFEGFISALIRYWLIEGRQEPLDSLVEKSKAAFLTTFGAKGN